MWYSLAIQAYQISQSSGCANGALDEILSALLFFCDYFKIWLSNRYAVRHGRERGERLNDFTDMYSKYAGPVRRFLLSLTQNEETAEELTQETLYRAFLHINSFREESSLYSWLCQIAKNLYLNERKKLAKSQASAAAHVLEGVNGEEWTQTLLLREQAMLVHQVLHSLPEPYKEVFTLKVFGELKSKDIANLFGKTESWAKMTFYRAKERIVKGMEEKA